MTKHRLELFSDGVFAIVLTMLVLDLRVPSAHGVAGLWEIAPALLVHAASFLVVASFWIVHHGVLVRVVEINSRTLKLNLLSLFWFLLSLATQYAPQRPLRNRRQSKTKDVSTPPSRDGLNFRCRKSHLRGHCMDYALACLCSYHSQCNRVAGPAESTGSGTAPRSASGPSLVAIPGIACVVLKEYCR